MVAVICHTITLLWPTHVQHVTANLWNKLAPSIPFPNENGQKAINLNFERTKYWLTVGAQPSEMVEKILVQAELIPQAPKPWMKEAAKRFQQQA
ncbi:unnamed protein product [Absidia cylindrospora]